MTIQRRVHKKMMTKEKEISIPVDDTQRLLTYATGLRGISYEDWILLKLALDENFQAMHKEARIFAFSEKIFERNANIFKR